VRRLWLAAAAGLLSAVSPGLGPDAPAPAPAHFTLVPVGAGAYAAVAKPGDRLSVGNAGFIVGSDGVVVVDAFATRGAAEELLAEIRRITHAPVRWVVNTHYHLDHAGGDAVFAKQGAAILAHENVRSWVRTENLKFREKAPPEEKAAIASLPLPDITYRDGLSIWPGERRVEVLVRPGHTGGDSVVYDAASNAIFAGDLFWKSTLPNLVDASTREWIRTLDELIAAHAAARFVPGHGEVGAALDVRFFRDYLNGLRLAVEHGIAQGKSGSGLVEMVLPDLRKRYGSWTWFDAFAQKNIEQTEQELKGTKRFPPTPTP
jgi:cyclase